MKSIRSHRKFNDKVSKGVGKLQGEEEMKFPWKVEAELSWLTMHVTPEFKWKARLDQTL